MVKVRIHEIAKELGIASRDVVKKAQELRINAKSASSHVTMQEAEELMHFIMSGENSLSETRNVKSKTLIFDETLKTLILDEMSKSISESMGYKYVSSLQQPELIEIEIKNLKTIKKLNWSIPFHKGIHVIISENGSGKSSLIISLAKLVQPSVLINEFIGKGFEETLIQYKLGDKEYIWNKLSHGWSCTRSDIQMPKLEGFFESSVHTGTRFKKINKNIKNIEVDKKYNDFISEADDFIKENMNYILYGDDKNIKKFSALYHIKTTRKRQKIDGKLESYNTDFYALFYNKTYIKEYFFSTGEYFLLSLLKFINSFKNKENKDTRLIIIDEIELSLHPLAQKRLMQKIKEFSEDYNILFIFATHSLQIIENVQPECIHYLNNNDGLCTLQSPIYPSYLSSKLYIHNSFDYIFLVEDKLAKTYLEKVIRKNVVRFSFSYMILPIGGWEKIYEMHNLHIQQKIYGNAKTQIAFDGDVKTIKEANENKHRSTPKLFLPFENLEKFVIGLIEEKNESFINFFNSHVYGKSIDELGFYISKDNMEEIKKSFKKFTEAFARASSVNHDTAIERVIDQIIKQSAEVENFKKFEKNILSFLNI